MTVCDICKRDITGKPAAVYSRTTGMHYCPPPEWDECSAVEEKTFAARPSKRHAA